MLKKMIYFCFVALFTFYSYAKENKNIVHIYYMHELQPTIFMTADILQRPKNELKIVFNSNIPEENDYNIIPLEMSLHNLTEIQNGSLYKTSDFSKFIEIYDQYKDANFIIHTGIFLSVNRIIPFLNHIPKERIKEIHLYESSAGRLKNGWNVNSFIFDKAVLNACIKYHCIKHTDLLFSLGLIYPTVYHIGFLDDIKQDERYKTFWANTSKTNASFVEMNFDKLSEELTQAQKEQLLSWYGFDYKAYKAEISNKKVEMFIVGHAAEYSHTEKVLVAIMDWYQRHKDDKDRILFVKWGRNEEILEMLNEEINVSVRSFFNIPFELLTLSDLLPDKVSGTPSTLFFNLPNEKIGNIYYLPYKKHIDFLLEKNKISQDQIIDLL